MKISNALGITNMVIELLAIEKISNQIPMLAELCILLNLNIMCSALNIIIMKIKKGFLEYHLHLIGAGRTSNFINLKEDNKDK